MTTQNQIILRPAAFSTVYRRRQSNSTQSLSTSSSGRMEEVAGGIAAGCVAVSCCCPCTVVNLLVLVVYKVPSGICKKALKNRRRRQMFKKGILPLPSFTNYDECKSFSNHRVEVVPGETKEVAVVVMGNRKTASDSDIVLDKDFLQLDEEMWGRFYTTGFWRSPSQRER